MATDLDLDINNYNITDIEKFFRFKPKSKYSESDIELREYEIREQLLNSGHINKKLKADLIHFLTLAKQWLIDIKCQKIIPTSIPKNYRLDTDNYPRSDEPPSRAENIIEKPKTPFIYTQNSEYFPGSLNPLDKRILTKLLCIDTLFRPNYDKTKSTDFVYTLPDTINNVVSMQLTAAEIPRMWNSFSTEDKNNTFTIELFNVCKTDAIGNRFSMDESGIVLTITSINLPSNIFENYKYTITIPDGNYDNAELMGSMNYILSNTLIDDYGNPSITLQFLVFEIDALTTNSIFRVKNDITEEFDTAPPYPYAINTPYYSPDMYFTINFDIESQRPIYKNLGWMLGFRKASYTVNMENTFMDIIRSNSVIVFEGYLKSESSYGSNLDNYVFLEIDDFHNNFPTDTIISMNSATSSYLGKNIMNRITISSAPKIIIDNNSSDKISKKREYFGPVKIEKMRIRLLNRFGDVINMNKNDYSFVLEINQLYSL